MVDDSWLASDVITHTRMNRKTIYIDTGANINALTPTAGMVAYCTATGSGFTLDHLYVRNNANSAWVDYTPVTPTPNYFMMINQCVAKTVSFNGLAYAGVVTTDITGAFSSTRGPVVSVVCQAFTWDRLTVYVTANTLNGSDTIGAEINAVLKNQSVGVGAGLTGIFQDTTNSDAVSNQDKIDFVHNTGGTAGSATFGSITSRGKM